MIKWILYLAVLATGAVLFNMVLAEAFGVDAVANIHQSLWVGVLWFIACISNDLASALRGWGKAKTRGAK